MAYSVPSYQEISHFRAPYKDSVAGFGDSGAVVMQTREAAAPSLPLVAKSPAFVAAKPSDQLGARFLSNLQKPSAVPAMLQGSGLAVGLKEFKAERAKFLLKRKTIRLPKNQVAEHVRILSNMLDDQANFSLRGFDKRLWPLTAVPTWDQLWRRKAVILLAKDSVFRNQFREYLATLIRSVDAADADLVVSMFFKSLKDSAQGFAVDAVPLKMKWKGFTKTFDFDPSAVDEIVKRNLAQGPQGRVFQTRAEADQFASEWSRLPQYRDKQYAVVNPASVWGLYSEVAIEDALKSDVASQRALLAAQRAAIVVKAVADAKRLAVAVPVETLKVVADAQKEKAKADAALASQDASADAKLAKAQADNAALRQSLEDIKEELASQGQPKAAVKLPSGEVIQPLTEPPAFIPEALPFPPKDADDLPVPKNAKNQVVDPKKLVPTGDTAKDEANVKADIKAAGADKPNLVPYAIGVVALGALAFVALKPRA